MGNQIEEFVVRAQVRNTQRGLKQFLAYKRLEGVDGAEGLDFSTSEDEKVSKPRPFDPDVKAGEVRTVPQARTFKNVLVLRKWDEDTWLVAPMSRIDWPVSDNEVLLPGGLGHWAKVVMGQLCATISNQEMKRTWILGTVDEQDLAFAMAAFRGWLGEKDPLHDTIVYRISIGRPVTGPDSPVLQHTADEMADIQLLYDKDLEIDGIDMPEDEELPEPDPELARKGRNPRKEPGV